MPGEINVEPLHDCSGILPNNSVWALLVEVVSEGCTGC